MMVKRNSRRLQRKLSLLQLLIAIGGVFLSLFGIVMFNQYFLMSFPLPFRLILMIVMQWLLLLVPGILMIVNGETLVDIGFTKKNIVQQIGMGVALAVSLSLVLTVLPIILGFKDMVGHVVYTQGWQFVYQFIYTIFGVALAEEFVFRGYLFHKLLEIKNARWFAILVSSLLFGVFHIFTGNIIQMIMTAFLGFIFSISREMIKGCTLLSLIFAHGIYDAMIVVWVSLL